MATHRRLTQRGPATPEMIAAAAECLRLGGLVAMPTETVYGLAGDATSDQAVAEIYAAKGRPAFNPLIAHVLGVEDALEHARLDGAAERLARAFWPGPLTLVAPAAPTCRVSLLARAGLDTLALRAPAHPAARALIEAAGRPLAAPSANRSGHVSATTADHVLADLDGRIDWVIDAGPSLHGIEFDDHRLPRGRPDAATPRRRAPGGDRDGARASARSSRRPRWRASGSGATRVALRTPRAPQTPGPRRRARRGGARFRRGLGRRGVGRSARLVAVGRRRRGGGEFIRVPTDAGQTGCCGDRRGADPRAGTWRGDQRPHAAGGSP